MRSLWLAHGAAQYRSSSQATCNWSRFSISLKSSCSCVVPLAPSAATYALQPTGASSMGTPFSSAVASSLQTVYPAVSSSAI